MESLYILIPLSAGLVLVILAVFGWAVHRGQFEDLDAEGERSHLVELHLRPIREGVVMALSAGHIRAEEDGQSVG